VGLSQPHCGSVRIDETYIRVRGEWRFQDGQVRLASAGGSATITGQIGADGSVGLSVRQGPASGSASGRLRSGSGTWKAASLCSGRWAAQRRSTLTAQAF
jgi:hypothetical protein